VLLINLPILFGYILLEEQSGFMKGCHVIFLL
jgi:hypothetical protein